MRTALISGVAAIGLVLAIPQAHAIGCLSGGAAGALAGHMAGHGVLGAIGGCIAGHQWHKHQQRMTQDAYMNQQSYVQSRKSVDPNYKSPWTNPQASGR
jgi:uncharacterized protein YcfJ